MSASLPSSFSHNLINPFLPASQLLLRLQAPLGPLDGPACKTPLEHRGTPSYLAPELWREEGLHSFATDFWALGCVLYELRRGQEPFGGAEVPHSELRRTIESLEPVRSPLAPFKEVKPAQADGRNNPGSNGDDHKNQKGRIPDRLPSMSAELGDVLGWLLEKQPQVRVCVCVCVCVCLLPSLLFASVSPSPTLTPPSSYAPRRAPIGRQ